MIEGRFLRWTGYARSIALAFGLGMIGCLMVLSVEPLEWIDLNRPVGVSILFAGFAIAIGAFGGLCIFVRCPRCRSRIIWKAVSGDAHPIALNGLMAATRCPTCGFPSVNSERPYNPATANAPQHDSTEKLDSLGEAVACLEGPVERIDGKLTLKIPLQEGGDQFVRCTRGISQIEEGCLTIVIQDWLAGMLRIEDGDLVTIDNANGKFNIRAVKPRSVH